MQNEVKLYQLKPGFAKHNNLLIYFVAKVLVETPRALYLYGHGTTETTKMGICCKCGRVLTHPVSVELGIGPECGKYFHDWDLIGGYNEKNLERLKGALVSITFDSWIPKSQIVQTFSSEETIDVPVDHPKLQKQELNSMLSKKRANIALNKWNEQVVQITFEYDLDVLFKIRSLPGRKYFPEDKTWSISIHIDSLEQLVDWGFVLDEHLQKILTDAKTTTNVIIDKPIKGLQKQLYKYQSEGVAFIEQNRGRALIADEMGLGKTIQALAWLQMHPEKMPVIIVTPASLKLNWEREIKTWMSNVNVSVLSGKTPDKRRIHTKGIMIINYNILAEWVSLLKSFNPAVLITDECHYYKSNKTKRTKAVKQLAKGILHVIALSGTPIVNRPIEAFNAIHIINPTLFVPWDYAKRYCNAKYNGFGWDFSGASHSDELHEKLTKTIMIRRLKKDVLKDLPDKTKSFVPLTLDNEAEYEKAENDFITFVRDTRGSEAARKAGNAEALTQIGVLKQIAVKGKLNQVIEWVQTFLEGSDQKLVIFAVHKFVIEALMNEFGDVAVKIDGSCSMNSRQQAIDRFQTDPSARIFVGNIKAAGVGITLTASSNVAIVELPWTPGELVQAEDRCHRIGQKDSVNIYYLLANNTIEERIAGLLDKKQKVLDAVLDGRESDPESMLSELMKSYIVELN